ncbi:DegT/DnrJ/EryC1/StrS family aminotransferase [Candidatus Poribacteria bacterium]|nr:DegT/DnrJ/EryC1/StrS family aminotransferase [Candidatus Poribacteria bacterium]
MSSSELAVRGGPKAVPEYEGRGEPKIGHDEFLEMARTWGYSDDAVKRIAAAVQGENIGGGPFFARYKSGSNVETMEREIEERFGVRHVLAVSSGTAALHTAYVAADIGRGDEVIVPGYTFLATAMAVVVARGVPVWCDIDESMTIDPKDVEARITSLTKAIAPVHMNGYVCDMDAIREIAQRHNLRIVEDCAQAYGASFRGRRVGTIGDLGCFSISSYKTTGGGEGGLVMCNDDALFARVQGWAEAGGLWRPDRFAKARWEGELFCGLNYRMSELEGTVDLVQTRKADAQLARWRANKRRILAGLGSYSGVTPQRIHDLGGEMGHSIGFFCPTAQAAADAAHALRAEGVSSGTRGPSANEDWHYYQHMWQILDRVPATSDGCPWHCPNAEEGPKTRYSADMCRRTVELTSRHVSVPLNQWWTERDCDAVARAIDKVLGALYGRNAGGASWLDAATGGAA